MKKRSTGRAPPFVADLDMRRALLVPLTRMFTRCLASLLGLVLASLFAMGGAVCAGTHESTGCCCARAGSPVAAPLMGMCCETACRERPDETPSTPPETAAQGLTPRLPSAPGRVEAIDEALALLVPVALKSVEASVTRQDPPDLYVQKRTFLI